MLFIAQKPTHLIFTSQQQIVITTQRHIYFTHLHFIELHIMTHLSDQNPLMLEYSHQKSQAVIGTPTSIELYWTDWQHRAELHLFLPLNNERIFSIYCPHSWHILGQFKQYSTKLVKLWNIQNISQQYPNCFVGHLQYIVNRKHLVVYNHKTKQRNKLKWQDSQQHIQTIHQHKLELKVYQLSQQVTLIQADNILIYVNDLTVQKTIIHDGELLITGPVATWISNGKMEIYTIKQGVVCSHGKCQVSDGHYYGAMIHQNTLITLFYDFKQLRSRQIKFASEEKLKDSYQQKLSRFEQLKEKEQFKHKSNYSNKLEVNSEPNQLSARSIQKALKASIGKFKEKFDKSFEEEKYNESSNLNVFKEAANRSVPNREVDYYLLNSLKGQNKAESKVSEKPKRQHSKQQHYDLSNGNSHIASYHYSCLSNPQQDTIQTPAFNTVDGFGGEHWSNLDKIWQKNDVKMQQIHIIDEQFDLDPAQSPFSSCFKPQKPESKHESKDQLKIQVIEESQSVEQIFIGQQSEVIEINKKGIDISNNKIKNESNEVIQSIKKFNDQPLQLSSQSNQSSNKKKILHSKVLEEKQQPLLKQSSDKNSYNLQELQQNNSSSLVKNNQLITKMFSSQVETKLHNWDQKSSLVNPFRTQEDQIIFLAQPKPPVKKTSLQHLDIFQNQPNNSQSHPYNTKKQQKLKQSEKFSFEQPKETLNMQNNSLMSPKGSAEVIKNSPRNSVKQQSAEDLINNRSRVLKPFVVQENKKYTQILTSVYRKFPQKFDQELQKAMPYIIHQKEARLFFAEHIRNFNPQLTKDKLLRLYSAVDDTDKNREAMSKALSQFKLNQVPENCLCLNPTVISIFRMVYPNVYIQDLLQPTVQLYQNFLKHYFSKQFTKQSITIEKVRIPLEHSRNLLNILLFLNDTFNLPTVRLFQIYIKLMLKNNESIAVKKIIQSNIPIVCQVDQSVFEQAAEKAIRELLEEEITDYTMIEKILPFLSNKNKKIFNQMVNLAEDFSVSRIFFDVNALLDLPHSKGSFKFLKDIIDTNPCSVLSKIDLPATLILISKIQEGKADSRYHPQAIQITKLLSKKLIENGYFTQGFANLAPIASVLKRAQIAALLIKYYQGHYANRLASVKLISPKQYTILFKQLISGITVKRGDPMPEAVQNKSAIISWKQFNNVCSALLKYNCWELNYLIFCDTALATNLIDQGILTQNELEQCYKALGYFWNFNKNALFPESQKIDYRPLRLGSESAPSNDSGDLFLSVKEKKGTKIKLRRSLKQQNYLSRSQQYLSKSLFEAEEDTNPQLFNIKFEVVPVESIKILRSYYQQTSIEQFFDALKLVDHQKVGINQKNIGNFKAIVNLKLDFTFKPLVPFEYFFDKEQAWNKIQDFLFCEITVNNFWILYLLVEILFGKSIETVYILINKLISYVKNDSWAPALEDIINKFSLSKEFLRKEAQNAANRGLICIQNALQKNL